MPRRQSKAARSTRRKDPHSKREAQRYERPIPSRELILEVLAEQGIPLKITEIAGSLGLTDEVDVESLNRRLRAMTRDGQLLCNRRGGYCLVDDRDLIAGRVIGHQDGFGFLHPDAGGDDLFLSAREMRRLWHGDRAVARVTGIDHRNRREGSVVEVLERNTTRVVGRLNIESEVALLTPDNKRMHHEVLVPLKALNGAKNGQIVMAELTSQPENHRAPIGRVVEVLGEHLAPGMPTEVALRTHNIPDEWPEDVERQVKRIKPQVQWQDIEGRWDLRGIPLVTIDGADARDFDDAVYCEPTDRGWRLYVCIADVSHYVQPDSPLDKEARKRATSVYFPDRVVPMLPEVLSNGLCSLNPGVDRLCMTAELLFDQKGKLLRTQTYSAVMHSHARLTYDQVGAMLHGQDQDLRRQHEGVLPHLFDLNKLFGLLHKVREQRGAIDFDTTETRFRFDEKGEVDAIVPLHRHDAHRIIEECMLAANVAVAQRLLRAKIAAMYRVHEQPSAEKLTDLRGFLAELGLKLGGADRPTAKHYAKLLEQVAGRDDSHMIQTVLLRSMMQAVYSAENLGHFGLAFDAYTHFTSPIRRYPDLMVHRALKHLESGGKAADFGYKQADLASLAEHCSMAERRADDATRDAADTLKCMYMEQHVGETFDGLIVSVTGFGVFVELKQVYVTGLVHITALDHDFFHFDPVGHRLTGERSGKVYRLADAIRVRVAAVNVDDRKIDLVLAKEDGAEAQEPPRKPKRRGKQRGGKGRRAK